MFLFQALNEKAKELMAKAKEAQYIRGSGAEPEFAALEDLFDDIQHKSTIRKEVNDSIMMHMNVMVSQMFVQQLALWALWRGPPVTGVFPSPRASYVESISMP